MVLAFFGGRAGHDDNDDEGADMNWNLLDLLLSLHEHYDVYSGDEFTRMANRIGLTRGEETCRLDQGGLN